MYIKSSKFNVRKGSMVKPKSEPRPRPNPKPPVTKITPRRGRGRPPHHDILFISSTFCSRALKEYLHLRDKGFDIMVAHSCTKNPLLSYVQHHVHYPYTSTSITKLIQTYKPRVVHGHNSPNSHIAWARKGFNGKIVFDIHDVRKPHHQAAVKAADCIYTVHDDYIKFINQRMGSTEKPMYAVPSIYFIKDFKPIPKLSMDGETHLCFIGSMYSPQTANLWSKMFKEMANRLKIHIHVHTNFFKHIVSEYADGNLHAEDPISFMDIPRTLSRYDAGFIPSGTATSLPNKFFDYINAGIPVIADSRRSTVSNITREEGFGIVVDKMENLNKKNLNGIKDMKIDMNKIKFTKPYETPPYKGLIK